MIQELSHRRAGGFISAIDLGHTGREAAECRPKLEAEA
jgi:hypothetical protein